MQLTRNFRFETTGLSRLEEGGLKQTRLIFRSLSEDQLQAELDLPGRACRAVDLTGHQVGSISRAASKSTYRQTITRKRSGADTERYAGLAFDDAAHLPSADQLPCYTRCLEREIVSVVHVEAVLEVVSG